MTRPSGPRATWFDDLQGLFGVEWGWLCKAGACGVEEKEGWEEGPDSSSGGQGHSVLQG